MEKYISSFKISNTDTASLAQNMNIDIGTMEGYIPFLIEGDKGKTTEEEWRADIREVLSSISKDSLFILQDPIWNTILEYRDTFIHELREHVDKLVVFVHDFFPLMFTSNLGYTEYIISWYNLADLVILPSRKMEEFLRNYGLTPPVLIQGMWDQYTEQEIDTPKKLQRVIKFPSGGPTRLLGVKQRKYETPLEIFTAQEEGKFSDKVVLRSHLPEEELRLEFNKGGFGLVWAENTPNNPVQDYYTMCHPYKFSTFLSAGLPIIIQKGVTSEKFIVDNKIGFVVDTLEEASHVVANITEEEYLDMVKRIAPISQ